VVALTLAWTALDILFNVTFPGPEPFGWYLLPSIDATVLLGICALVRLPGPALALVGVLVVVVRLFRFGDGLTHRYFNQPLSLALDLPLADELPRLLVATAPRPLLLAGLVLALASLVGLGWLAARAVRVAEGALRERAARRVFAGVVAVAVLGSLFAGASERRLGLFGRSAVPRLARELAFAASLDGHRAAEVRKVAEVQKGLGGRHDLARLRGAPVLIFLVESYGATVLDQYPALIESSYARLEARLGRAGFHVASGLLDSPTYAGRSWLAQQTLLTGVRTTDRVGDAVVQAARPRTMARIFGEAGYRSVLVMPANRYRGIPRWLYDFDSAYQGWDFDYHGPAFGWASMPDQYVVGVVHREVLAGPPGPVLIVYALQSSHAPWREQPPLVADWAQLGDGSIFNTLPARRFDVHWTSLAQAGTAYVRSVEYDLEVLVGYLEAFSLGDALVVIAGDHQPVAEVTRFSPSRAVPVHVISRRADLVTPFLSREYVPGMRPPAGAPARGMETFLQGFLEDFSTEY
jgi:hypothetical protein